MTEENSPDSSIDGSIDASIQDFLKSKGILYADTSLSPNITNFPRPENDPEPSFDETEVLLYNCKRINSLLLERGYLPVGLTISDVNAQDQSISVFVIDSWAASILAGLTELLERDNRLNERIQKTNSSSWKDLLTTDALNSAISELQEKLYVAEKKDNLNIARIKELEETIRSSDLKHRDSDSALKKKLRSSELHGKELERRCRQRETELERIREKFRMSVDREREVQSKNKETLSKFRTYEKDATSSKIDVIETLVIENAKVHQQNKYLVEQLKDLSTLCQNLQNNSDFNSLASPTSETAFPLDSSLRCERVGPAAGVNASTNSIEEMLNESERTKSKAEIGIRQSTKDSCMKVDMLTHRVQILESKVGEREELIRDLRRKGNDMQELIENLRLELEARPTMKQWSQKNRELKETEDKLHDLIVLRKESSELESWRKHLNTQDRIRADRRNYDLGLWLIDSLPRESMREALQAVCRELDVSNISELQPCVARLKLVLKAVPRMEGFITKICAFVFQRAKKLNQDQKVAMEEVFPILESWWAGLQVGHHLSEFQNLIHQEFCRRERLIKVRTESSQDETPKESSVDGQLAAFSVIYDKGRWPANKSSGNMLEVIRDLVDFQIFVLRQNENIRMVQEFIKDNAEDTTNRILNHLMYLFDVSKFDGLIPKMNQVYLFSQEMKTFLGQARDALGFSSNSVSDNILVGHIIRKITYSNDL